MKLNQNVRGKSVVCNIVNLFMFLQIFSIDAADCDVSPSISGTHRPMKKHLNQIHNWLNPSHQTVERNTNNQSDGFLCTYASIDENVAQHKRRARTKSKSQKNFSFQKQEGKEIVQVSSNEQLSQKNFWPPWPLNLLTQNKNDASISTQDRFQYRSGASLFFRYCRERTKLGVFQLQHVLSDACFHLPPSAPVIIPLAILPYRQSLKSIATDAAASASASISTSPRMLIHKLSRNMALASLSVAVLSWADYEVRKTKRLTPLPLTMNNGNGDMNDKILPPFLPERVPPPDPLLKNLVVTDKNEINGAKEKISSNIKSEASKSVDKSSTASVKTGPGTNVTATNEEENDTTNDGSAGRLPKLRQQLVTMYGSASKKAQEQLPITFSSTVSQWKLLRVEKKRKLEEDHRNVIFQGLVELQSLKRKGKTQRHHDNQNSFPLGYALVTGASRGLGRAIAVELARWEIPLVLVARDMAKLKSLAEDIETCYNVPCCIIQADLSNPATADKLFKTTKEAGIDVDILVNNAGICTYGEAVDSEVDEIDKILNLNTVSVSKLAHLYGKEMKRRRRGRILFVSSIVGALPSGPGVATYAATKAFEKSLALSMGKELESYGVGVTCLMPGAIKGTAFTSPSSAGGKTVSTNALCWKIPFYANTAPEVASKGVRAVLSGDAEVVNGLLNRLVVRVMQPLLPQRLTSMIVETSFKPLKLSLPFVNGVGLDRESQMENGNAYESLIIAKEKRTGKRDPSLFKSPPQVLTLKESEEGDKIPLGEKDNDAIMSSDLEEPSKEEPTTDAQTEPEDSIEEKEFIERSVTDYAKRNEITAE